LTVISRWFGRGAAEIPDTAHHQGTGFRVDEELRDLAVLEPGAVGVDNLDHVGGFALDRQLARPHQSRKPGFTGGKGAAIGGHFIVAQLPEDASRQHGLDEAVLVEHQAFSGARPKSAEHPIATGSKIFPTSRRRDGLHVSDRFDLLAVPEGPIEAECRAPVVHYERDLLPQSQRLEPVVEITGVVDEAVGPARRRRRSPHADQIRRETAADIADRRDDIAPEIGGGRVAVQKDNRTARSPGVDVAHLAIADPDASPRKRIDGADRRIVGENGHVALPELTCATAWRLADKDVRRNVFLRGHVLTGEVMDSAVFNGTRAGAPRSPARKRNGARDFFLVVGGVVHAAFAVRFAPRCPKAARSCASSHRFRSMPPP
jgi:hypothetical protein